MKLVRDITALTLAMLTIAVAPPPAVAYQEAGHYYTVALLAYSVIPHLSPEDAHIIAFCTQLPDQSADLDAVVVYQTAMTHSPFSWLAWAVGTSVTSPDVRRMITVQQLLHGLTGGKATAVRDVARATVRTLRQQTPQAEDADGNRAASLCALGLALHLYGDSFAHRMMGEPGQLDPDKVYSTGKGHALDLHYPDLPLCGAYKDAPRAFDHCVTGADTQRFVRWHNGWADGADLLGSNGTGGSIAVDLENTVAQKVLRLAAGASDTNMWNEAEMESSLASLVANAHPVAAFFVKHDSSEPCSVVLGAAFQEQILPSSALFQCRQAWGKFETVAAQAFDSTPDSRQDLGFDPNREYMSPFASSGS